MVAEATTPLMRPDFGKSSDDYDRYRPAFDERVYARLHAMGFGIAGQKILDLGAGTGLFGAGLRGKCCVTSLDIASDLLVCTDGQRVVGEAEYLPFVNGSFDAISAAQCWHWLDRNRAPREVCRVLRPSGIVAVVYQTYIPLPGSVAEATEKLILQHHPGWRHANSTGVNGQVLRDLQIHGFINIESFSFDVEIPFAAEQWHGFIQTTSAVAPSMNPDQLRQFNAAHLNMLEGFPRQLLIPHRIFCVLARKPLRSP